MGPPESLRSTTSNYYKQLKREGLNPFDLLSWQALLNLELETRYAGRQRAFRDGNIHRLTRKQIWEALQRKAEDMDVQEGGDRWDTYLGELRSKT